MYRYHRVPSLPSPLPRQDRLWNTTTTGANSSLCVLLSAEFNILNFTLDNSFLGEAPRAFHPLSLQRPGLGGQQPFIGLRCVCCSLAYKLLAVAELPLQLAVWQLLGGYGLAALKFRTAILLLCILALPGRVVGCCQVVNSTW